MAVTIGSATETHALAVAMDGASMGVALTVRSDEDEAALRDLVNALVREILARVARTVRARKQREQWAGWAIRQQASYNFLAKS